MNKIYIIKVHAGNYEEYQEDHYEWDFNCKAFSTKEKAEIWLSNVEEHIEDICRSDDVLGSYYSDMPISFERVGNASKDCIYDTWYGNRKSGDVRRWDRHFYQFIIEEMGVDE